MPETPGQVQADNIAKAVVDRLEPRLGAIERSIRGDDLGNPGLVRRIDSVERVHQSIDAVHAEMRATAANAAAAKADRHEVEDLSEQVRRLSQRIDRAFWAFVGAGIASGGGAAAIARILGGP